MARETTRPQAVVMEDVRCVEEYPPVADHTPGIVRVLVGLVDDKGNFPPQQFTVYTIEGDAYSELCGAAPTWAPDKPPGTYRNDDLWHFIDLQRAAAAQAAAATVGQDA